MTYDEIKAVYAGLVQSESLRDRCLIKAAELSAAGDHAESLKTMKQAQILDPMIEANLDYFLEAAAVYFGGTDEQA